jgi:hypothetical protein
VVVVVVIVHSRKKLGKSPLYIPVGEVVISDSTD